MRVCTRSAATAKALSSSPSSCPCAAKYVRSRVTNSSGANSRMCSALMASAFFWSNRAGFELTSVTSKAVTISASEKMS
ncbi:Uncharacterised protein [Mycobacteroides abscessus]|nr:Uncharacterised protein [Mycobacteroides abscessus]